MPEVYKCCKDLNFAFLFTISLDLVNFNKLNMSIMYIDVFNLALTHLF